MSFIRAAAQYRAFCIPIILVIVGLAESCGGGGSPVSSITVVSSMPQAVAPVLSPSGGNFTSAQTVTILESTPSAAVYYTLDGSAPTTASTKYSIPFTVTSTTTVNAIAAGSGYSNSSIATATFTISLPQAATPTYTPAAATYATAQTVAISDSTAGAAIYYTTDGSVPTTSSLHYTTPLTVSSTQTINAIATASGFATSAAASGTFTIATPTSSISVNPSNVGPAISSQILGMNMAYWFNPANSALIPALHSAGIYTLRWPGGSGSDYYHWKSNTLCDNDYTAPNSDFPDMAKDLVAAGNFDLAITANYGTNAACNAGGDPTEAAAWVTEALNLNVNVTHWTVGNESFGYWEKDLHPAAHDPATYANAVASGYYPLMKAANPNALIGVVVDGGFTATWDPIVLANAPYDFVEYHFYPQIDGHENDTYLVSEAANTLTTEIEFIRNELSVAGHPNTPIYVGEIGSVNTNPGKQTSSITQALFAGQVLGEMMNNGISRATWWIGFGGCSDASSGNFSSSLYGWQNFGGYMVFSDGTPESGCTSAPSTPIGTMLPTARAYELFSNVAKTGESALTATVAGDTADVRAYAATSNSGTILVLFNLNESTAQTVSVSVTGQVQSSGVAIQTYDKAIYDQSKANVWAAPSVSNIGVQGLPLTMTLTPWSMNVVTVGR